MAVHYVGGGGGLGLFGSILGGLASVIPGMQAAAPYIMGASALASGDPLGAVTSVAGGIKQRQQNNSMFNTMWNSAGQGLPHFASDPVTGELDPWRNSWRMGGGI